jgi:dipeptidyl aminopeptidase/acylaminoacyl peptidase
MSIDRHVRAGRLTLVAVVLLAAAAGPAARQPGAPTLSQLMSAPFPTDLVAAPSGGALAWVFNDRGIRNIWIAQPPNYQGRRLTGYDRDDGQGIGNLVFTADGQSLLFVRGGSASRQGDLPNPTSDPAGVEQAIWIVPIGGGEPTRLADGSGIALAPSGDRIAYLVRGKIWTVALGGGRPERLVDVRGQLAQLRWSPDGSKLAFTSTRGDHAFVGVYDTAAKSVSFLDPSVDRDGYPAWSPDGRRVAFVRVPAQRLRFAFGPQRESADPWSIRVVEVETERATEVFRALPGRGSVRQNVIADNQVLWGAGDRLVFPWERDGWLNLYAVGAAGGTPQLLTPGNYEVEHVTLTPDRSAVVFSSNQEEPGSHDIDRRHVYRVPVAGGRVEAMTRGATIEWSPVVASDGHAVAFLRSDARTPAHPAIQSAGRTRELAPASMPADYPAAALVVPEPVVFTAADGMPIRGQLFLPPGRAAGTKHPAVAFFHGGSRRQMLLGWHYGEYYHRAYAFNQYLALRGYVVLSVNYRSGTGYGLDFREALNYGATGASEFQDVLGAGLYLRGRADVDPVRVGLWGGSYGGYLTALGLSRASDLFAAGVDIHGVHEWNAVIRNFVDTYDPAARGDEARLAFDSSPMASVATWRSPVLLIHGDDDRNVPFSETVNLVEALRRQGVEFEQLIFPDEIHSFLLHRTWIRAFEAAGEFFDRKLKGSAGSKGPTGPTGSRF